MENVRDFITVRVQYNTREGHDLWILVLSSCACLPSIHGDGIGKSFAVSSVAKFCSPDDGN